MLRSTGDIRRNPTAANFGFSPSSPGQSTFPQANPFSLSPFTNLQQDHKVAGRIWKHLLENKHLGDNKIFICTLNSIYQSHSQALDGCFAETRTAAAPQARHGTALTWDAGEHGESTALRKSQAARAKQKSSGTRLGKPYSLGLEIEKQQCRIVQILAQLTPTGFFWAKIGQKMNKVCCSMATHA